MKVGSECNTLLTNASNHLTTRSSRRFLSKYVRMTSPLCITTLSRILFVESFNDVGSERYEFSRPALDRIPTFRPPLIAQVSEEPKPRPEICFADQAYPVCRSKVPLMTPSTMLCSGVRVSGTFSGEEGRAFSTLEAGDVRAGGLGAMHSIARTFIKL